MTAAVSMGGIAPALRGGATSPSARVPTPCFAALALTLALCACGDDGRSGADAGDAQSNPFGNADANGGDAGTRAGEGASGGSGTGTRAEGGSSADASADAGDQAADDASTDDSGMPTSDAGAAGGTPGGPMGTQPLGALCANDGNCSQAMGEAVCCVNSCELAADCPESPGYLPCTTGEDCAAFGGGKICCELGDARFCTKRSACAGDEIP
jgi:hypothetical protein